MHPKALRLSLSRQSDLSVQVLKQQLPRRGGPQDMQSKEKKKRLKPTASGWGTLSTKVRCCSSWAEAQGAKRSLSAVPAGTPLGASTPEGINWLSEKEIVQMFPCSRLHPNVTCDCPCSCMPHHTFVTSPYSRFNAQIVPNSAGLLRRCIVEISPCVWGCIA
jgi:hypothetical protein